MRCAFVVECATCAAPDRGVVVIDVAMCNGSFPGIISPKGVRSRPLHHQLVGVFVPKEPFAICRCRRRPVQSGPAI
jgi:hypothetical protein